MMVGINLIVGALYAILGMSYANETLCPGGLVKCPDYMTCCQLANMEYGCCPFPTAVCCPDHVHCCPQNMKCDVIHQACLKNGFPVKFFWNVPVQPELLEVVDSESKTLDLQAETNEAEQPQDNLDERKCPDEHVCPGTFTCCKMYSGKYGCCPFDGAECCLDGFHCCPKGSHCNPDTGGCYHEKMNFTMNAYSMKTKLPKATKSKAKPKPFHHNVAVPGGKCPDGHPCPNKLTCCKVISQGFGCCPYSDGVCCTDLMHCCPHGTTCNTTLGTCDVQKNLRWSVPAHFLQTATLLEVPELEKNSAVEILNETDIVCPNRRYHCNDGETCCPVGGGAYGCCPMPLATCCPDKQHCCPHGYDCVSGTCQRRTTDSRNHLQLFLEKLPTPIRDGKQTSSDITLPNSDVTLPSDEVADILCPDFQTQCPDGNTCCPITGGRYGCCPMQEATCCGDLETCCPYGYWCTDEGCERMPQTISNLLPFLNKIPISPSL
ncbi:hypothetical protein OTU49_003104 [Cherax quadricarinatus]|uniref:Granulins domain-containing protein n=2 Tax=Cherax quadricarinatus TaxID=27406 RepID=A0AAW0XIL6_CHEQU